ncbi:ovostatin-like [Engystomops pustulosus]|uniref:ovostatin-like n=1 Tax=Engystomops pustulosus TaxID=76066 RepID=UPI003AFADD2B
MYLTGMILSLALLIAGGRSKPQCSFTIPVLLRSGTMGKGCLDVKRHTEPINVEIILEVSGVNHTILKEQIPPVDTFKCPEFQVPVLLKPAPVFLSLSAVGTNYRYTSRNAVVVAPDGKFTMMQLERSIYKPGQQVKLNLIALDNDLKPVEETYPLISVTNPSGRRLFEWKDKQTSNSILPISFNVSDDPDLGSYTIQAQPQSGNLVSRSFDVDEYVVPNFGTDISAPKSITILDTILTIEVTAKYTYGEPVPGNVDIKLRRAPINYYIGNACNRNPDGLFTTSTGKLDSKGTMNGEIDLRIFQLDRPGYEMRFTLQVTVTENASGIQVTESRFISITSQMGRVSFNRENMDPVYKPKLPFYVEVTAEDGLQNPMSDQTIELQLNGETIYNMTTDGNGKAHYYIDTSELKQSEANIQVIFKNSEQCYDSNFIVPTYSTDYYAIKRHYSRSGSFVHVERPKEDLECGKTHTLSAKYIFSKSGLQEGETGTSFNYMIMSRTTIINFGSVPVDSLQGKFAIPVKVTADHAPLIVIVVYTMLENEIVTDTLRLNTEKCFRHQVSMNFSEEKAAPGAPINVEITSAPRSLCAMRIMDSSLSLLRQDQALTPAMVYSSLKHISQNGYNIEGYNVAPPPPSCIKNDNQFLIDGLYYSLIDFPNERDAYQELSEAGVIMMTDITLNKPILCTQSSFIRPPIFFDGGFSGNLNFAASEVMRPMAAVADGVSDDQGGVATQIESERKSFPEVWKFDIIETGESGSLSVPTVVPGTITQWNGDLICLSPAEGFGMTKEVAKMTSFLTFFVEMASPYSMIRGESLMLKATVFNYMESCMKVRVQMEPSDDFTVEAMDEDNEKCVCSGERASFIYKMKANSVGQMPMRVTGETVHIGDTCEGPADPNEPPRKDTFERPLIVEAEGMPKQATKSTFVCVHDTNEVIPISISIPDNSVPDSVKAKITAIGDISGHALTNPESVLKEPIGSGEQNVGILIVLIHVHKYLETTGRLTKELRSRIVDHMGTAYRRQIRYLTPEGSFSNFPGGKGSSWLTLRVCEAFVMLKPYTFVEESILNQALIYLERLKNPNGGFTAQGDRFNAALGDGADDDISFTAAMAGFLMKTSLPGTATLLREALTFLGEASQRDLTVYNTAFMFYIFRAAEDEERSNAMFNKLKSLQKEEGGTIHWEEKNKPNMPTSDTFSQRALSVQIEITAYVLLSLHTRGLPRPADDSYTSQIARWISQHQSADGAYSNTWDTAVALQAMTAYGATVHRKDANNVVQVKAGDTMVKEFILGSENRILPQSQPLATPGEYSVTVSGKGCVLIQTTVDFNIPVKNDDSAFLMSVSTPPESCVDGVAYTIPLHINVSYNGLHSESNMAIIDLALPSGYTPEYQSMLELKKRVPKVEARNKHIIIYLDSVSRNVIYLSLTLQMGTRVQNFQPTYAYIRNYYAQEETGAAVVCHPCSTQ